jgi:hypothetical protein
MALQTIMRCNDAMTLPLESSCQDVTVHFVIFN